MIVLQYCIALDTRREVSAVVLAGAMGESVRVVSCELERNIGMCNLVLGVVYADDDGTYDPSDVCEWLLLPDIGHDLERALVRGVVPLMVETSGALCNLQLTQPCAHVRAI